MIRGTKNEGISSLSKQRHTAGGTVALYTGVKGQSYELTETTATGVVGESRDEFDAHATTLSEFPSNAFNGTFE